MKKLFLAAVVASAMASLSFGAAACTGASNGTLSGTLASFVAGTASITNCDLGDKFFSNFTTNGSTNGINVQISQGNGLIYQVIFTIPNGLTTAQTFSFQTNVDTTNFPFARIIQFQDQMNTAQVPPTTFTPNASTAVDTHTGFNTVNLNAITGANETAQTNVSSVTQSVTTISYNPAGTVGQPAGQAFSFEVDIIQSAVPEPMTMSLMGFGLLAVGAFARRFKK